MASEKDESVLAAERRAARPGRKPKELFYRAEAEAWVARLRTELRGSHIEGLTVEYVCRNNGAHRYTERRPYYEKERTCVFCDCLMTATVVKEPTCTEPM